jgi:tetratricopeptide (TPR) repeat protein
MWRVRRARLCAILCVAATAATTPSISSAQTQTQAQSFPNPQSSDLNQRGAAVDRLHIWVESVRQHQPGAGDEAAARIASWPPADLDDLWIELQSLLRLMDAPRTSGFTVWADGPRGQVVKTVVYTRSEFGRLRRLAIAVGGRDPDVPPKPDDDRRVNAAINRLLKRGAAMHTTIAVERPHNVETNPNPFAAWRDAVILFADGRQVGLNRAANHWRFARTLLDRVAPAASADGAVRVWYRASSAALLSNLQLRPEHLASGLRLFPDDAALLTFSGSLHEALAAPRVQAFVRSASLPRGVKLTVGSTRAELGQAESLFRRALSIDPRAVEARLRLGRVLSLLERNRDALNELRQLDSSAPSMLQYYGSLFIGSAAEALGLADEARAAYERAATLYPLAHAPRFALSQLAASTGNASAAVDTLEPALSSTPDPAADPFWTYHQAAGRDADMLIAEAYRALLAETTP